jgi:hypothetical protein
LDSSSFLHDFDRKNEVSMGQIIVRESKRQQIAHVYKSHDFNEKPFKEFHRYDDYDDPLNSSSPKITTDLK